MGKWRKGKQWAAKELAFTFAGTCEATGKVIFPNRKAAKQNRKIYRDNSAVYSCEHCGGIHLGHANGYDRQQHREWNQDRSAVS